LRWVIKSKGILCPGCKKLVSKDEPVCQYCGEKYPGSILKNNIVLDALRNDDFVKKSIIGANIVFFIISLFLSFRGISFSLNPLDFLSPDNRVLLVLGGSGKIPVDQLGFWWTFVSAGYLHGSILHIIFNMIAFTQLFPLVLNFYGISRSFIIYFFGGVCGFLLSYLSGTPLTIGASASICGLIGASFFYGISRGGMYGNIVYKQVSGWIVSLVVFGLLIPGIDNFGHLGGFLGGALSGFVFGYLEKNREKVHDRIIAGVLAIITIAILGFCVINGFRIFFGQF
jgi:rhomboid protease GluP